MSRTRTTSQVGNLSPGGTSDTAQRARGADIRPLPAAHLLAIGAERAGRHRAATHHMVTADITRTRSLITASPAGLSFTAFTVACVARAVAEHPEVHAYRDWRGRCVTHRHVDVTVPIETRTPNGSLVTECVVRDADIRDVEGISAELRAAEGGRQRSGLEGITERFPFLMRVPGVARALCTVLDRSVWARRRTGTVAVTTVGRPGTGSGFGIIPPSLMPLRVVVGGTTRRPHTSGHLIDWHEMLDLTITFDRHLVTDASAARFVERLRSMIDDAEVLPQQWPS